MSKVLKSKNNLITQNYKKGIHEGVDLIGENKSLDYITAHSDGIIIEVRNNYRTNDRKGHSYGNYVKIQHENKYFTFYAHLKYGSVTVNVGDKVKEGQIIGYMGDSGHAEGAHLHFEVRNKKNKQINPTNYIEKDFKKEIFEFSIGRYIVDTDVLTVRTSPFIDENDSNWLKFDKLTQNAKEQIKKLNKSDRLPNGLTKGVICDVTEISGEWGHIASGWICLNFCKRI